MKLDKEELLGIYRRMVTIRFFEESLVDHYKEGHVPGTTHLSIGEEAVAVGACSALSEQDYLVSTHRAHGHLLARGVSTPIIMAEVFAKATGCTGGKGGSMHISDFDRYVVGSNGIAGGGITIAGGLGLAIKMQKTSQVCLCFFGDGASQRGVFHEALNLASLWKVPTVFLCTNNQYAMSLPLRLGCANIDICARAAVYNMPGHKVDGTDVLAVYDAVESAVEDARKGKGPSLIECVTYRWVGHSARADVVLGGDSYRAEGEVEEWQRKGDPIEIFKHRLTGMGHMTDEIANKIEAQARQEIDEAVNYAMNSPEPTPESVFDGIYAYEEGN